MWKWVAFVVTEKKKVIFFKHIGGNIKGGKALLQAQMLSAEILSFGFGGSRCSANIIQRFCVIDESMLIQRWVVMNF